MNWKHLCLVFALVAGLLPAQTRPEFAVTSVKPNKKDCCTEGGVGNGGGGGKNATLKMLIGIAYRRQQFQISGGPSWIGSERFDVEGKAEDPKASYDDLRLMLQSLLEDRFKLKIHRATKVSSVYALVVDKGGSKIKLSADQISPEVNGPSLPGAGPNRGAIRIGAGNLIGHATTLSLFTTMLSQRMDRLVVDRTNLSGRFDLQLHWTPSLSESPFDPGGNRIATEIIDMSGKTLAPDPNGPSIFTAVQEQLGLKLESAKAPVEVLVIDHVERPSGN